jgi:hypothetical protein
MARMTVRRYVAADPDISTLAPGQLVMTTQEISIFTRNRIIGSLAETGRVCSRRTDASGFARVVWNFSRGEGPASSLRAVKIVPQGTPGAIEAWVDPLLRYEVWSDVPGADGPVLLGFSGYPEICEAGERRVDRWQVAQISTCPGPAPAAPRP